MSLQPRTSRGMPRMPAHACPIVCRGTLWVFVFLVCCFFFLRKKKHGGRGFELWVLFRCNAMPKFWNCPFFKKKSVFLQRLKFSWIFGVLRAIEEVGRPHFLERRFDFQKFWVLKKRVLIFFCKKSVLTRLEKKQKRSGSSLFFF